MKITPLEQYQLDLKSPGFVSDPAQKNAMTALTRVYTAVLSNQGWIANLRDRVGAPKTIKGLYMWGRVGSGKTYLMDTFFNSLPSERRQRIHFHKFMRHVQQRMAELKGKQEPLYLIARDFAKQVKVICFDEFFVDDIGDAMILGHLLKHLFELGITLVITSNIPVDDLYKDGLQRQRFMPTIALLRQYCQLLEVNNKVDYRLKNIATDGHYFTPLNEAATQNLQNRFDNYSHNKEICPNKLEINDREISAIQCAEGILWLSFDELCKKPRNTQDYLILAKQYPTVLISDVPILNAHNNNSAKRFIHAIDIFYDEKVHLILSADTDIDQLYQGTLCLEKFKRTTSRLHEMQTKDYFKETMAYKKTS